MHTFDPHTPMDETLRALDDLVRQGKVRYIGCSNFTAWQVCKALWTSDRHNLVRYDSVQPAYSPADRRIEPELVPAVPRPGGRPAGLLPARGRHPDRQVQARRRAAAGLAGADSAAVRARLNERNLALAVAMQRLAAEAGITVAQLTLAWVIGRPGITTALVGATRVAQQEENLKAVDVTLAPEMAKRIDELSQEFVTF